MKKYIYATLVAGTALFFTGCSDDLEQVSIKRTGEEILFGGRAGFEMTGDAANSKTRTVYTGNIWEAENEAGEKKTYEGVNWVKDDKVRIFCQNAAGTQVADYTVSATNEEAIEGTEEHEVYLEKIGNVGLQWSDATDYEFFAVYPSPQQYPLNSNDEPDANYANNVLNGGTSVKGKIPSVQSYRKYDEANGNYTLHPRMEYAYMVARQKVEDANKTDNEVYLNFVPIATAVEIELKNVSNKTLELTNILVASADDNPIYGDFTADLSKLTDGNTDKVYTGIPTEGFVEVGTGTGTQITIPTYDTNGGLQGNPIALADEKTLKFTVFMLPTQNVADLKITLVGVEGNRVGTTRGITITQHKKTYLKQMPISVKQGEFDLSKWVEYLPDNAYLKGLSIPGAGGASSGNVYSESSTIKNYLEQTLSIENLWKQGIRCFEFTVDVQTDASKGLGDVNVYCNAQNTGLSLSDCVNEVNRLLGLNPEEFAMVIITYQQQGGWNIRNQTTGVVTQSRNPATFMTQLNAYWSGLTMPTGIEKKLYSSNLTVNDARGKLFCIARPTSNGEDNYAIVNDNANTTLTSTTYPTSIATPIVTDPNILVIHGWGALKDKWYARGFTDCIYLRGTGNTAFTTAIGNSEQAALGYNTINSARPGRPFDVAGCTRDEFATLPTKANGYADKTTDLNLTTNFYYSTISQSDGGSLQTNKAWVQEWVRVAKETKTFILEECNDGVFGGHPNHSFIGGKDGVAIKWISSLDEKKNHIATTLDYALAQKIGETTASDVVFINSLCGYYINATTDNPESAYPNSLTDGNAAYSANRLKFNQLTAASNKAGMCGDIASFATDINDYFYDLLQDVTTNPDFEPGPMGIILMDRVSSNKNDNGSKIPSIIIANNFQYELPSAPATAALSMPRSDYDPQNDGGPAAKTRSNNSNGGFTITWE